MNLVEHLKEKRPWTVWVMLADSVFSIALLIISFAFKPSVQYSHTIVVVGLGIEVGILQLLLHTKQLGRYLYIWKALGFPESPIKLAIFAIRLYCALNKRVRQFFAAHASVQKFMKQSKHTST